jgi:anti-sigma factor RsiW
MITRMPRSCVVHRAALLDFVDGQPRTAVTGAALSHLERCRGCEDELASIVRTVAALRRLGRTSAAVEPSAQAWPALRARVATRPAQRWMPRFSIAGLAVSAALAVVISMPATITQGGAEWNYRAAPSREGEAPALRSVPQRPARREAVAATIATPVSVPHFNPRLYGEGTWSPAPGAPKPRPR